MILNHPESPHLQPFYPQWHPLISDHLANSVDGAEKLASIPSLATPIFHTLTPIFVLEVCLWSANGIQTCLSRIINLRREGRIVSRNGDFLFIRTAMCGGVLVDPVFLFIAHAAAARNLTGGTPLVLGTG